MSVTKPPVLAVQLTDPELLAKFLRKGCFVHKAADPESCTVEANVKFHVNQQDAFTLFLRDTKGNACQGKNKIEANLVSLQGSTIKAKIEHVSPSQIKVYFTPKQQGRHKLNMKVNGACIKDSPFTMMVSMQPKPKRLSLSVATISGLKQPSNLIYSQGIILATEMEQNQIITLDSQHQVRELQNFLGVNKLTQDSALNLYITTTNHKLHKLSKGGVKIKKIGQLGMKNAEFSYPNGL